MHISIRLHIVCVVYFNKRCSIHLVHDFNEHLQHKRVIYLKYTMQLFDSFY